MNIFKHIEISFQNKLPFVAYRKSNSNMVSGFFQKTGKLYTTSNYSDSGFIFAPFDNKDNAILIPQKDADFIQEKIVFDINHPLENNTDESNISKESHISLIKKGVKAIHESNFKKVVLSRKEIVKLSEFDLLITFQKLLQTYPLAMVYIWFHPEIGLWLGATPETLFKINNNDYQTMSLAGTQTYNGTTAVKWDQKEIDEQQFVTDYIINNLKDVSDNISTSNTETIKAGNLLHLRTKISGSFTGDNSKLILTLHPTPAVCGLPKEKTKQFILKNENYERNFYTGFLGELNIKKNQLINSELFVNLRCMEIINNEAHIFIGGGITKDSNPEKEWQETVAKSKTMKKVL